MTKVSTKARRAAQASAQEPKPVGNGEQCPVCRNHAQLENGKCVCCEARKAAEAKEARLAAQRTGRA